MTLGSMSLRRGVRNCFFLHTRRIFNIQPQNILLTIHKVYFKDSSPSFRWTKKEQHSKTAVMTFDYLSIGALADENSIS